MTPTELEQTRIVAESAIEIVQDCRKTLGLEKGELLTKAVTRLADDRERLRDKLECAEHERDEALSALGKAQRERDEIAARTYDACIAVADKVANHTDDLVRGAVRTQSSGGAGHQIGYGSAARDVVEQIKALRKAWPVLPGPADSRADQSTSGVKE